LNIISVDIVHNNESEVEKDDEYGYVIMG